MSDDLRPTVLFDLDGTLVDTNYLHALSWSRALRAAGEWAPMNAIHRLVGMGGDQLVPELLGHDCPDASARRPGYYKELAGDIVAFPGAVELLHKVHDAGVAVVLATSAPSDQLEALLELLQPGDAIDGSTNADEVERSKPHPDIFLTAMETSGADAARTLAVGDSVWDVEAARAAGIGCVCVETGGFSHHELSEAGALQVYRDVMELCQQFRTSPLGLLC
jgi:HAD superfamily hydrolase (TIGR01509 family)